VHHGLLSRTLISGAASESSDIQARYNNAMAHSGEFLSQIQQEITAPISVFSFGT